MEREKCIRCGGELVYLGQEQLQMGKYGLLLGALDNLMSGALALAIYCCKACKKLEFYAVAAPEEENSITRVPCPHCGELHELNDAKCPYCGKRLY